MESIQTVHVDSEYDEHGGIYYGSAVIRGVRLMANGPATFDLNDNSGSSTSTEPLHTANNNQKMSVICDSEESVYADAKSDIRAASDIESDECEEEDDDYYQSDSSDHEDETMHHLLQRDIDILTFLYGDNSVQYRRFVNLDDVDVDLHIPIRFLDSVFADAWKVNKSEPLIVRLHLSSGLYIESSRIPDIAVFQPSSTKNFGFCCQIQKIIETYLAQQWAQLYREYEKYCEKSSAQMETEDMSSNCATSVAKLIDMGFEKTKAENALAISGGHIIEASNLLLEHPDKCDSDVNLHKSAVGTEDTQLKHSNGTRDLLNKSGLVKRQSSQPGEVTKKKFWKHLNFKRTISHVGSTGPIKCMEDLNLMPLQTNDGFDVQIAPSIADGFLVQLFRYVRQRIPTVNEYCVICDNRHIFHNSAMLKPTVCQRELCVFAFQTLGVMANAAEDIATDAEVIDVLIHMTRLACKSSRRELIFDPFPTVIDPGKPSELLFNPKEKNFNLVQQVIDSIPAMDKMIGKSASLKRDMDATNRFMYPFLQWIITSNRSHTVKLPQDKQLPFMNTPHQFLLISSPPAKEMVFQAAKQQYDSTFAFHGSAIENWHSIIRQGLINASGTKFQVNGAAYGQGIYLSPNASTSMSYSRMMCTPKDKKSKTEGSRFLSGDNITCIAICEVVLGKNLKKNDSIWVMPNPDYVCTRFLFVYENGTAPDSSVVTTDRKIFDQLRQACVSI